MPSDDHKNIRLVRGQDDPAALIGHDRLIRTLLTIGDLSEADQTAIRGLAGRIRNLDAYEDIVSEGERPTAIAVLISGFACRYKILADGARQIVSFHIPGDAPDLQSLYMERMDHSVMTLQESTVLHVSHEALFDLFKRAPQSVPVFWRYTMVDASMFREWVANVGQRDSYARVAHLLCETMTRMKAVGLAQDATCELPITQAELADATGISTVHLNRSLQALRRDGLIRWEAGALTVLDWKELQKVAGFDPGYLHLRENAA